MNEEKTKESISEKIYGSNLIEIVKILKDNPESLKAYLVHCEKVLQIKTQSDLEMQKQRDSFDVEMQKQRDSFDVEMQKQRDNFDIEDKRIKSQFWEKVLSVTGDIAEAYIDNDCTVFDPNEKVDNKQSNVYRKGGFCS